MLDKQIEDSLYREIITATYARYGTEPDGVIMDRIKAEWEVVKRTDLVPDIAFLHEFTTWMRTQQVLCQVRPGGILIKLVPYIRYKVCFQYMLLITNSFHDNPEVAQMLFPCIISHVLYHSFDTKKYSRISIDDMCFALHSKKFEQQLYKALSEADITLDKPNVAKTVQIVEQELSHCL